MYQSTIPTKLNRSEYKTKKAWIKARTLELYDMLPQTTLTEREQYTEIRDEILRLNYSFLGYVAKETYVTDPMATYEDKLQSAALNFCKMWAKYKFAAEYRTDLSFAVFFKPRLKECIRRELNTIKYSLRRQVCMKAAAQLGKHWGQVNKEDISKVHLNPQEMQILESIFCTQYDNSYDDSTISAKLKSTKPDFIIANGIDDIYTEQYDDLEDLIIHEMIEQESKLDDAYLLKMSQMYGIPYCDLIRARPLGELKLKLQLEETLDVKDAFESGNDFEDLVDVED